VNEGESFAGGLRLRDERLGAGRLVSYALPSIGTSFLFALMLVGYLSYATEVLGVSASLVGLVFLGARVWDGLSDPLAGYLSDRTRARLGRRKSWLLAASPALLVTAIAAWSPPAALTGNALALWIAAAVFAFYTAFTLFEVPHMALGAELTQHRRDRVRVFGVRQFASTLGLFAAFGLGASLLEDLSTARERLSSLVTIAGVFTAVSILWTIKALPRERADYAARGPSGSLRAARDVWRNRDARILLFVYTAEQIATGGVGVLVPFLVRHVVRMPDMIAEMLVSYTLPALLSVPVWMALGERFDKRRLWLIAMGMSGVGFGLLLFIGEGTIALMLVASLLAGSAAGCGPTLGQALKADVIDGDDLATGERKEGAYFAAWNLVRKFAAGAMIAAVGFALDLSGFVAGAPEQTDTAKNTMIVLTGGVPIVGFAVAIALFRRFGMTQAKHARILVALAARDGGR
jgi:GPH family glycoside/pentoside/hexuronide:cation symporter